MKKLLGGLAISALLVVPALAADLPARMPVKAPVPVVAAYSWTGCYLGVQGGWQWGRDHTRETITAMGAFNNFDRHWDSDGFVGGGHIGCNWQTGQWVFGVEGDFEGSTLDGGYTLANGN